jgi:hypothetical protein
MHFTWIPAFAGMTESALDRIITIFLILHPSRLPFIQKRIHPLLPFRRDAQAGDHFGGVWFELFGRH